MMKPVVAFISIAVIAVVISGWTSTRADRSMMARAAGAQAPTPTVSVTTLPAMPGTPTSAPPTSQSTFAPIITPAPPVETPALPTPPPVGVAYIPVTGQVMTPINVTLSQLQHMKPVSLALRFHTYTGVPLTDVLALARPTFPDDPQTLMRKYVYFQGFKGQSAILSFPEFSKQFNGQLVLLAYLVDLRDVKPPGFIQLVVQGDKTDARFIKVAHIVIGEPPAPQ
jgi:DMSO/TMAO reductase YedYZ molybdopterin-dependent catalytic subunit